MNKVTGHVCILPLYVVLLSTLLTLTLAGKSSYTDLDEKIIALLEEDCLNVRTIPQDNRTELKIGRVPGSTEPRCVYQLHPEPSHYLEIRLKTVEVSPSTAHVKCFTCMCGSVRVYDGSKALLADWCYGRYTSRLVTSFGGSLSVIYVPDLQHSFNTTIIVEAFSVSETSTKKITRDPSAQFHTGSFASYEFPVPYRANDNQMWILENNRKNTTLRLRFNDLLITNPEQPNLCSQDLIQIYEGYPKVGGNKKTMCGKTPPQDFYSENDIVTVTFSTHNSAGNFTQNNIGFNATYAFYDKLTRDNPYRECGLYNDSETNFGMEFDLRVLENLDDLPRFYDIHHDLRCHWLLVAPKGFDMFIVTVNNFNYSSKAAGSRSPQLTVRDGLFSSSAALASLDRSIAPTTRITPNVTSGNRLRLDMFYPADTLGRVRFTYTAARWRDESAGDSNKSGAGAVATCKTDEFECASNVMRSLGHGSSQFVTEKRYYCVSARVVCDRVTNCVNGEDEENCGSIGEELGEVPVKSGVSTLLIIGAISIIAIIVVASFIGFYMHCSKSGSSFFNTHEVLNDSAAPSGPPTHTRQRHPSGDVHARNRIGSHGGGGGRRGTNASRRSTGHEDDGQISIANRLDRSRAASLGAASTTDCDNADNERHDIPTLDYESIVTPQPLVIAAGPIWVAPPAYEQSLYMHGPGNSPNLPAVCETEEDSAGAGQGHGVNSDRTQLIDDAFDS